MKIKEIHSLEIPDILVIKFQRFCDERGCFTELFRESVIEHNVDLKHLRGVRFVQANESFSRKGVVRGLHFQWNPYQGKLVRTIQGHMIDLILDVRKNSPTCGKIIAHDMPCRVEDDWGKWIYLPPGFAHGNIFLEDTMIQYFCTGEYSPECEARVTPLDKGLDWSMCEFGLHKKIREIFSGDIILSEKDRKGFGLNNWLSHENSEKFLYGKC